MENEQFRFNTFSCKPILIITPDIHKVDTCIYCNRKLSQFTTIELYSQHEKETINGKACIDCDIIYASNKIPDKVINEISSKFGKDMLIEHKDLSPSNNIGKRYNNESARIQRFFNGKNKTILPSSRSKSRSM